MFCISPYKLAINGIECYLALNLFFGGDNTESVFGTATPAGPLLALSVLSYSLSICSVPLILPHPRQTNADDEYIRISLYMCLFQARPLICINGSFFFALKMMTGFPIS
eukprot:TRINITY_DN3006_c0_g1_i4.p2 TRINITY_DN3006_c0_g1~~TRINITY_DN3006_c0_g1_i4.p2  ORF type:complete len:109 (+),score=4.66 TRINITY_DN3006_c0_g1_i4:958-1284(+)